MARARQKRVVAGSRKVLAAGDRLAIAQVSAGSDINSTPPPNRHIEMEYSSLPPALPPLAAKGLSDATPTMSRLESIKAKLRHLWNQMFFAGAHTLIFLNQLTLMLPLLYHKNKPPPPPVAGEEKRPLSPVHVKRHYRTHRLITGLAIFVCVFLSISAPFLLKLHNELYGRARRQRDSLFKIIAQFTIATDVFGSLLIMASQIWHRERLAEVLNGLMELLARMRCFERQLVSFRVFVALIVKVALAIYAMTLSVPFLVTAYRRLSTTNILAFIGCHCLEHLSTLFALILFTVICLMLILSEQLERQLALTTDNIKMLQLIDMYRSLSRLITLYVSVTQFGVFIIILLKFVTILCNIYAMLDYYVSLHRIFMTFMTYIISLSLDIYSLILMMYLCDRSQRRVRDELLLREEKLFLKVVHM